MFRVGKTTVSASASLHYIPLRLTNRLFNSQTTSQLQSRHTATMQAAKDTVQAAKNTIAQNFGGDTAHSLARPEHQFSISDIPDLSGKVAVVTGGSEGIGYGVTHSLLTNNIAKLFILSLSREVVDGATEAITRELGVQYANRTHWIQCDLSNWKRVSEVAEEIRQATDRLDILVNNAARGIMSYQLGEYGVEQHMALNHFGHVILTSHLLPLMEKTATTSNPVRIVNLASNLHESAPKDTKFASLDELNQDLGPNGQYARSKLATLLHARYLAAHVSSVQPTILVNAVHPGIVATAQTQKWIHEPYPNAGYAMSVGMEPFKKSQFEGALSTLYAATKTQNTGEYICPPAIPEPGSPLAQDMQLAEQLMKLTREITNQKTEAKAKGCPIDDAPESGKA